MALRAVAVEVQTLVRTIPQGNLPPAVPTTQHGVGRYERACRTATVLAPTSATARRRRCCGGRSRPTGRPSSSSSRTQPIRLRCPRSWSRRWRPSSGAGFCPSCIGRRRSSSEARRRSHPHDSGPPRAHRRRVDMDAAPSQADRNPCSGQDRSRHGDPALQFGRWMAAQRTFLEEAPLPSGGGGSASNPTGVRSLFSPPGGQSGRARRRVVDRSGATGQRVAILKSGLFSLSPVNAGPG